MKAKLYTTGLISAAMLATFLLGETARAQADYDYSPTDYKPAVSYASQVGNRKLIDMPTAYTLPRGSFDLNFQVHAGGGLIAATDIGLSDFLQVGFSYGANNVFSQQDPQYNPSVEFDIKWKLTDDGVGLPGLAVGFASQGTGPYLTHYQRSTYKPVGLYAVMTHKIGILGYVWEMHGGVNYSMEKEINVPEPDRGVNLFTGLSTEMRHNLRFAIEYNAAMDDNSGTGQPFGQGRGYLNAAIKWTYFDNLQIEFTARDLLGNRRETESFERGLRIVYLEYF